MSTSKQADRATRPFDIVVFGATGFTGQLVCEYLARNTDPGTTRWAIAGRSREKLEGVRRRLAELDPRCAALELLEARSDDRPSLDDMAARARVVLTTVGPYALHGRELIAACVDAGTDYVDLTGEPDFWQAAIEAHHERAVVNEALIVSCCGFDSVPHDLGALYTVQKLAIKPGERATVRGYITARGSFSGGTWSSLVNALANLRTSGGARVGSQKGKALQFSREIGRWALRMPTIDPLVVRRSAAFVSDYGDDFHFRLSITFRSIFQVVGLGAFLGATALLAQTRPTRRLLQRLRPSGAGPSPEQRARSFFRVTFFGEAGDRQVTTRVSGGDPGYDETAKMISEAALALAHDRERLPARGGVLTPAAALGDVLRARLEAAGIRFELLGPRGDVSHPATAGAEA
ncbi:MAG: saccharopine dehydrogenase NADP-binding domain-containing protein [Myxococcales bacterium]|nr:saccharopine dehydrogenase NADP-binding domain-containing protein [Myxococcales bacterium]